MFHRCRSGGSRGVAWLGLETRHEADVDDGAPEAGHPALTNVSHPARQSDMNRTSMLLTGPRDRGVTHVMEIRRTNHFYEAS
jgi:hypothetical protein